MSENDQRHRRSFSDALYQRYCDFQWTFDHFNEDYEIVFYIGSSSKKFKESDLIFHTSTIVLADQGISHVGDRSLIRRFCSHVEFIDLSSNEFDDWNEISLLLSSLPKVKTINFSFNPFPSYFYQFPSDTPWSNLLTLCLNGTFLPLQMLMEFLRQCSYLEELHICSNRYRTFSFDRSDRHGNLKRLYISNNHLTDWKSICSLGWLFPSLETLIANENSLETFQSSDDLSQCFPRLTTLSVDHVKIDHWNDIIALTKFPCLSALRISSAPLFEPYGKDERFFLVLGYMKNIRKLNGTDINPHERETHERRFIRFYSQRDDKPQRYWELIEQHGHLNPLVDIRIETAFLIQVRLIHNQTILEKSIDVRQTVRQFKKYLQELLHIPWHRLRVFYIDDMALKLGLDGTEELKYPQRLLHTYNIHEGDQFHIDLKVDALKSRTVKSKTSTSFSPTIIDKTIGIEKSNHLDEDADLLMAAALAWKTLKNESNL